MMPSFSPSVRTLHGNMSEPLAVSELKRPFATLTSDSYKGATSRGFGSEKRW